MSLPLCASQEGIVLNSAHLKPSVTPLGGSARPVTAPARRATGRGPPTVTCVWGGTLLYMGSALWLTAHWDNSMMVRGTTIIRPYFKMSTSVIFLKQFFDLEETRHSESQVIKVQHDTWASGHSGVRDSIVHATWFPDGNNCFSVMGGQCGVSGIWMVFECLLRTC